MATVPSLASAGPTRLEDGEDSLSSGEASRLVLRRECSVEALAWESLPKILGRVSQGWLHPVSALAMAQLPTRLHVGGTVL